MSLMGFDEVLIGNAGLKDADVSLVARGRWVR